MQSSSYVPQRRNYQSPGPWAARSIYGVLNHQKLPQAECEELEHLGLQLQDLEEREQPDVAIIDLQLVDAPADALRMQDLFKLCEGDYDRSIVVEMEKRVLFILGWSVRCSTVDAFLHLICAREGDDEEVQHMATYLGILSMPHRTFVETKPSAIARSCLIVARADKYYEVVGDVIPPLLYKVKFNEP
ncbi:hypothetical protein FANTH_13361 [Fusarium anthophilum]|uniref:Cyclin C-terminal domain-containing protein n=1 Tax=Fusarium anthophilum TaxID=48485 RepID=A0A8H5DQ26_9HYPO|nr:hypothetical protein FANTH_13361 [Fusarium anthophilum]